MELQIKLHPKLVMSKYILRFHSNIQPKFSYIVDFQIVRLFVKNTINEAKIGACQFV